jgi:hypothetical protein
MLEHVRVENPTDADQHLLVYVRIKIKQNQLKRIKHILDLVSRSSKVPFIMKCLVFLSGL